MGCESEPSEILRDTHNWCGVRVTECQEELETMQLNGVLRDALLGQEVLNLDSLVTLELDNLASLLIFDEGTVASEFLSDRAKSVRVKQGKPASRPFGRPPVARMNVPS